MASDSEGAARKQSNGPAVSSGDSSAVTPKPAIPPASDPPSPGSYDATMVPTTPTPYDATMAGGTRGGSTSINHPIFAAIGSVVLDVGTVLGGRYEIQKLLGMGGMGAVYKALDQELDRPVGLKVIRPDLAGNAEILARFKQELILARQVTHRNIIRIFDLSEADGMKFITMEYVDGEDLRGIFMRQTKLEPEDAVGVIEQVAAGLAAAHSEGVIHRDLKPSNIMRDASGRVVVMDFGLARTLKGDGMTQTGMMIGTMEYMSPEQAMGTALDARSDLFAVGLIFYEALSGKIPFRAESAIASLVKRTTERAMPLAELDATIPAGLSDIVSKCLERDPAQRYASAHALIEDLHAWRGKSPLTHATGMISPLSASVSAPPTAPIVVTPKFAPWKWAAIGTTVVVLAGGAYIVRGRFPSSQDNSATVAKAPATSLAILPYYNASGDASLNWVGSTVSETLSSDVGQSATLRIVSPDRLQQVLRDLHISPDSQLDVATLKRVAEFTNADTVVFGSYVKTGEQIVMTSTILDLKRDSKTSFRTEIPQEKDLLKSLDTVAGEFRQRLAASPQILKELEAHSDHVNTNSVPALRAYDEGTRLARQGNDTNAVKKLEEATTADPGFALAFSRLGQIYSKLGYDDKAEAASRHAVELSDNLPAKERYLIQANHARIMNDTTKAIDAYETLVKMSPDDGDVQFILAGLYEDANNFDAARKHFSAVLASDSKNVDALLASGRVEIKASNPQAGLDYLNRALSLAIQFDNQEIKSSILQAMGIAYQGMNKPDEALRTFQEALTIRKKIGQQRGIAGSLDQIAQVQDTLGNATAALASYKEALAVRRQIGDKRGIALSLLDLGAFYHDHAKYEDALTNFKEALQGFRDLGDELSQSLCLNDIGSVYFNRSDFQEALTYFQQAYEIREKLKATSELDESLHNLAETKVKLGQYDAALAQYMSALEDRRKSGDRQGVADESASIGALFAAQGRYSASLASREDAFKTYEQLNDRTFNMVNIMGGYGIALANVGRLDEGQKKIEEALKLAAEVKNDPTTAQCLNWLGDTYLYRGDNTAARQQYERGLQIANSKHLPEQVALSSFNLARLDVMQKHSKSAAPVLAKLAQQADSLGLKALSVQASLWSAQASLDAKQFDAAKQEAFRALNRADKLALRVEQARIHFLLGSVLSQSGNAKDAVPHYRETVRILESIAKENGAARVLERADIKDMYHDSMKSFQGVS